MKQAALKSHGFRKNIRQARKYNKRFEDADLAIDSGC